jgi:pimeloyl-ACP methyl ester carboxylesterase
MLVISRLIRHVSVAVLGATMTAGPALAQAPGAAGSTGANADTAASSFTVLVGGVRVGSEQVMLSRAADGWTVSSTGRLEQPLDQTTTRFEIRYGVDWQPQRLVLDATVHGQPLHVATTFGPTTASNDITRGQQHTTTTQAVPPRPVVLPTNVFAAYEVLAERLAGAGRGTQVALYAAPDASMTAVVDRVSSTRVAMPTGTIDLQAIVLTITGPAGAQRVELWIDGRHRLARVALPASGIIAIRDDLATVTAREERLRNPGDEDVFLPANGFNLAATVTRPASVDPHAPVAILVAGAGPEDRDHTVYGLPMFAQIAGALASAGIVVVRYDGRGTGESGGRNENIGLAEYAEDVQAVIGGLRKRTGIDADRVALIGYAAAAPVALVAADRDKHVKAVALLAAGSTNGRDLTLEQQQLLLTQMALPAADRAARIALQNRIMDATITGRGWDGIPPETRHQADTAWFRSWLTFDPARAIAKLDQPILILQGGRDAELPASHADRLEAIGRARKVPPAATTKIVLPDANHLLARAEEGAESDYAVTASLGVEPAATRALADWIKTAVSSK